MSDWMIQLSGPLGQQGNVLAALRSSGVDVDQDHGPRGFDTDSTVGWIVARHPDVDAAVTVLDGTDWVLRAHWPTPTCEACGGHSVNNGVACEACNSTGRTEKKG